MIEKIKFILYESIQSLRRYPLYSFISTLTIMVCLIIISFIIYLSNITNNISENFANNESVLKIFINNSISNEESEEICKNINSEYNFNNLVFQDKETLFNNVDNKLKSWLKEDLNFIPCLCSINISLKNINEIEATITSIRTKYKEKIEKIIYPSSYLSKFEKMLSLTYSIIFLIGIIIFMVSVFNISNIIKLSIESRRNLIEILELHGAKKYFIKAPFIIEGIIHGFFGFLCSSIIITIVFNAFTVNLYTHFLATSLITTIPYDIYIFLNLIIGILLGLIGSNLGVSKYIE